MSRGCQAHFRSRSARQERRDLGIRVVSGEHYISEPDQQNDRHNDEDEGIRVIRVSLAGLEVKRSRRCKSTTKSGRSRHAAGLRDFAQLASDRRYSVRALARAVQHHICLFRRRKD